MKTIEKKREITLPRGDRELIEFFRKYVGLLKRQKEGKKFEKKLKKYEYQITEILKGNVSDIDNPLLTLISRYRLNRAEFKVFMCLISGAYKKILRNLEEDIDEDIIEDGLSARHLVNLFEMEEKEIERAIFDRDSALNKNRIIEFRRGDWIESDMDSIIVISNTLKRHLSFIREEKKTKSMKFIKQSEVEKLIPSVLPEDIGNFINRYLNPETASQIDKLIHLLQKVNCHIREGKGTLLFPVLVFYGECKREMELVTYYLARLLERSIVECKYNTHIDYYDYIDEEDMYEDDIGYLTNRPILFDILNISIFDYIFRINISKGSELMALNKIITEHPDARKNLIVITSSRKIDSRHLGIDKIKNHIVDIEFRPPDENIRRSIWMATIPHQYYAGDLYDELAKRFKNFSMEQIELTTSRAIEEMFIEEKEKIEDRYLIDIADEIAKTKTEAKDTEDDLLEPIAFKTIKCSERFKDVVLGDATKKEVERITMAIMDKERFYKEIFENKLNYGKGVKVLFYGPPGTGKTLTARAIAGESGLPLLELDLSLLMNPLVGMTEKFIVRYFETAQNENAILFIDECDSLVMSREHRTHSWEFSHINVLLKQIENFDGVLILSTNFENIRDRAINRRIHFFVKFDPPNYEMRKILFNSLVPEKYHSLFNADTICREEFTGGELKNVWTRIGIRLFCNEEVNSETFIEEIRREREKSNTEEVKKCGF